mgnify:FL=1
MNQEQREAAHKLGFTNMKQKSSEMKQHALNACRKAEETNTFMLNLLKEREMPNVAEEMTKMWNEEVHRRHLKIDRDMDRKKEWFQNLPHSDEESEDPPQQKQ